MTHQVKLIGDRWFIGLDGAAELIGVTSMTLRNWMADNAAPPYDTAHSMFPMRELGDWIGRERLFKTGRGGSYPFLPDLTRLPGNKAGSEDGGDVLDKQREETLLARERRRLLEIEREEKLGRLVDTEVMKTAILRMVTTVKTRLLQIPSSMARTLHGERDVHAVQSLLDRAIRDALEELSAEQIEVSDDVE